MNDPIVISDSGRQGLLIFGYMNAVMALLCGRG